MDMEYISPSGKLYRKTILALFFGSFVTFADLYSTQPVIPVIAEQFHVLPANASLALSFSTGMLAICLFIISIFSGAGDRKPIMGAALTFSALCSISVGFVHSLPLLLAIRAIQGAALAGFPSIAMAYITEEFHPKSLGYVIGIYVSGSSIGGLAGRLIVGSLSDFLNWNIAIGCLGALSLLISMAFWRMLPPSKHILANPISLRSIRSSLIHNLKNRGLLFLYAIGFLLMGSFVAIFNYAGIPLMEPPYNLSQTLVGFIFIIYLAGTFSSAWMGKLADRMDRTKVISAGILLMIAGGALTLSGSMVMKIAGLTAFTFGFFGSHSIASSWVGILANKNEKAQASSLYLLFYYAGSSLIGAAGGVFLHSYGWGGVIGAAGILLAAAFVLALFIGKTENAFLREDG
ncbi:MFS transporter, YNFM family, putative membrane transport protein [Bacillus sp. OV322]|uniref:MFS transporter n=1 Tax=Bacillus sp. OV322 TaxID=1882764 RepID=UPI0008E18215|nr:MFS transporter [Bacillus sp. OV322]SFC30241.1 MFS transporter, YNFM family, putative membrane transport protein [Bacillus sp. OV322]